MSLISLTPLILCSYVFNITKECLEFRKVKKIQDSTLEVSSKLEKELIKARRFQNIMNQLTYIRRFATAVIDYICDPVNDSSIICIEKEIALTMIVFAFLGNSLSTFLLSFLFLFLLHSKGFVSFIPCCFRFIVIKIARSGCRKSRGLYVAYQIILNKWKGKV